MSFIKKYFDKLHNGYLSIRFIVWFVFIHEFIFDFYQLEGESMLPTFDAYGDIVIVEKFSKFFKKKNYTKGEIVCLTNPINNSMSLCKRILYLEGETLTLTNGHEYKVPKNHIWVEGDNKDNSLDSRKFGAIPKQLIQGRVYMQIWPKYCNFAKY
jgi:inner membrane protease subunit 1